MALQLRPLVHQIDRAVDRLDQRELAALELLEETEVFVERQLHRYEYPWVISWIVSRCHDVNRFRSPQTKVLLRLSTSFPLGRFPYLQVRSLKQSQSLRWCQF